MSFYFQGNQISYNDIINYFNDMKTSRDNYKKEQIKIKNNEEIKITTFNRWLSKNLNNP